MRRFAAALTTPRTPQLLMVACLLAGWEAAAHLAPKTPLAGTPIVPSFEEIFGPSLLGMADYWKFPFWAPITALGGEKTYRGALLALGYHSALSIGRLAAGLAIGAAFGIGLGLVIAWSPLLRRADLPAAQRLPHDSAARDDPAVPVLGRNEQRGRDRLRRGRDRGRLPCRDRSTRSPTCLRATSSTPARSARRPDRSMRRVVLPAILPELFSSVTLTLGLAWSAVIAGEYVGIDSGLGRILIFAQFMSQTGRMALIAILLIVYAGRELCGCNRHRAARAGLDAGSQGDHYGDPAGESDGARHGRQPRHRRA